MSGSEVYVILIPLPAPIVTISSLTGNTASVMGTSPITFTATISGAGSSTVSATLSNSVTGTIVSDPSTCILTVGGVTSCNFSIIPWYTGFDNSTVGLANYDPFTPSGTQIMLSATNGATISGIGVSANSISYSITIPYIYLPAPQEGAATESNAGITWGAGGTVSNRFEAGTSDGGVACPSGQEVRVDNLTGLMWTRTPNNGFYTWANARAFPAIPLIYCGYTNWRLPTINELRSLLNYAATQEGSTPAAWLNDPAQGFTDVRDHAYWSSTVYDLPVTKAWVVDFGYGIFSPHEADEDTYVWSVRNR